MKDNYIQLQRQRRAIRSSRFKDYEHKNIVENFSTDNSKCYKPIPAKLKISKTLSLSERFMTGINWMIVKLIQTV